VVHRTDERLATAATASATLAPFAASALTLPVAGLTVEIRLAVTAELAWLPVLLRLLSALALHLLAVAPAALLAATTSSPTSTAASRVRVSIL
jgi:hypothetical protein